MNKHQGSTFDDFLREEGIYEEVNAHALKTIVAMMLVEAMEKEGVTKHEMAQRMGTSRSQLDRVLDPSYVTIQLDTLMKAARAVGQNVRVEFEPLPTGAATAHKGAASTRKSVAPPREDMVSTREERAAVQKRAVAVKGAGSVRKRTGGDQRVAARTSRGAAVRR